MHGVVWTSKLVLLRLLFSSLFFGILFPLFAGAQIFAPDSLRKALEQAKGDAAIELTIALGKSYLEIDTDSSIYILRKLLNDKSRALKPVHRGDAHLALSNTYRLIGQSAEALLEARKAEEIYLQIDDSNGVSTVWANKGIIFWNRHNYQLALDHFVRAMKFKEAMGHENGTASLQCNIGNIYTSLHKFDQARVHYIQAQQTFIRLGNKRGISYTHNNLGVIEEESGNFDQAISHFLSAHEIDKALGDKYGMSMSYFNLADLYRKMSQLSLSKEYFERSLALAQEMSNAEGIARALHALGVLESLRGNHREAIRLASDSYMISKSLKLKSAHASALEVLIDAHENLSEPQKSLDYLRELIGVRDSIAAEENKVALSEVQTRYETERREKENELLVKENTLKDERLTRHRLLNNVYIGAIVLVLLILFFIINRFQLIRRNQEMLQEMNTSLEDKVDQRTHDLQKALYNAEKADKLKTYFLANINHELKTPMNGVIGMSEYLKDHVENPELKSVADGLLETGKRLSNSLSSILELAEHESKLKDIEVEHFKPELLVYECLTYFQVEIEQKGLDLEVVNYAGDQFVSSNRRYFIRILDSLVSNAVKYTEKGRIKIELNRDIAAGHPTFAVRVYDTGIGIHEIELLEIFNAFQTSQDQIARGYEGLGIGLTVARKYAELLGGEISVDSRLGHGSVFTLRLPLHS